jgi:SAM-dependent methyltransferase
MITQRQYWDKKINEWSASSYDLKTSSVGITERIAAHFRQVDKRKQAAIDLLRPLIKGKTVLDLGCGLGDFCFDLVKYDPKQVVGLDIADSAIKIAIKRAKKLKLSKKVSFVLANVSDLNKLPECDYVVGLGFIDYLNDGESKYLFKLIGKRPYLFSYFERKLSLFNFIHALYIRSQGCPGAYKFTREEMRKIVPDKCLLVQKLGLQFITNITKLKSTDSKDEL